MRKYSLLLAVVLAASFATVADAAKKKPKAPPKPKDAAYEWNLKNIPPPPAKAAPAAATQAKAAKKSKKKARRS
jgi:hypothetical protein